jgi:hypothetical protein
LIEEIISEFNGYISLKQSAKKIRVKKPVPVEKTVARIKYQKKDEALNLTSLPPTKLHHATEAYLYDTVRRKLIYLVADDYSKCLIVKGTAILGFDKKKSQSKTLRKPQEQLKEFMKVGKPASRKVFDEIKAVSAIPNGRPNANTIILKVW